MEQLQDQVSSLLLTLEKPELILVCERLKCSAPVDGFQTKTRRTLFRIVDRALEEIEESQNPDEFSKGLTDLLSYLESLKQSEGNEKTSEIETLKQEYAQLQQAQAEAQRALEEKIGGLMSNKLQDTKSPYWWTWSRWQDNLGCRI